MEKENPENFDDYFTEKNNNAWYRVYFCENMWEANQNFAGFPVQTSIFIEFDSR